MIAPFSSGAFFSRARALAERHHNTALFLGGFLFDVLTIKRIDAGLDLALQFAYLAGLTLILILQFRENEDGWRPGRFLARVWSYNVEILHFLYGGLLSAYTVLYFKSSSGSRPVFFFLMILVLMVINEMPQVRRVGRRLRLGLYAFCVASYMIYLIPILAGRMGGIVFAASLAVSAGILWGVAWVLARKSADRERVRRRLFAPAGVVLGLVAALYFLRLIPPVPLSVQFAEIYHAVERTPDGFVFKTPRPPWTRFWRKQSRPFLSRPGDSIAYFVRLYAPSRFRHPVRIRWEVRRNGTYVSTDVMPLSVVGGRLAGFRGYAVKSNYHPGQWRVIAETEDGRAIGVLSFDVRRDDGISERRWRVLRDAG